LVPDENDTQQHRTTGTHVHACRRKDADPQSQCSDCEGQPLLSALLHVPWRSLCCCYCCCSSIVSNGAAEIPLVGICHVYRTVVLFKRALCVKILT
jgi:hypothetical protein